MAKEILAVPEEHLEEVILVLRTGLKTAKVSKEVHERLSRWCDEEEKYIERLKGEDD